MFTRITICTLLGLVCVFVQAQNSVQQDVFGQTGYKSPIDDIFILNLTNKSIQVSLKINKSLKQKVKTASESDDFSQIKLHVLGFNGRVFSNESWAAVFNSSRSLIDSKLGLYFAKTFIRPIRFSVSSPDLEQYDSKTVYLSAGFVNSFSKTYESTNQIFRDRNTLGPHLEIGYARSKLFHLIGVNFSAESTDNAKELEVSQYIVLSGASLPVQQVQNTSYAYPEEAYAGRLWKVNFSADYSLNVGSLSRKNTIKRVYLATHLRYRKVENLKNSLRWGLGAYVGDNKRVSRMFFGWSYFFNVVSDPRDSNINLNFGIFI